jgi:hypothetical protein
MKKLTIQKTILKIIGLKISGDLPEHWAEIPEKSFLAYSEAYTALYFNQEANKQQLAEATIKLRTILFPSLTGIKARHIKRIPAPLMVGETGIISFTDFLLQPDPVTSFYIKKIRAGRKTLHAPDDNFSGVTFGEFIYADTYYLQYLETKEKELLHKFIAVLFRPKQAKTNPESPEFTGFRQKFNEKTINARSKRIKMLKNLKKQAILSNYTIIRSNLIKGYPYLFPTQKQTDQPRESVNTQMWVHIVNQIRPRWQSNDTILNLPFREALTDLDRQIAENAQKRTKSNPL